MVIILKMGMCFVLCQVEISGIMLIDVEVWVWSAYAFMVDNACTVGLEVELKQILGSSCNEE